MKIQFIQLLKTLLKEGGCILIGDVAFQTRSDLENVIRKTRMDVFLEEVYVRQ